MQFIGKLMRLVEPSVLDEVRTALNDQLGGSAQDKLRLHQAELWRDRLLLDDDALGAWLTAHTDTDAQQLRALIRQARKDAQPEKPGAAVRHGRAYRDVFQIVRERLERVPEPEADTALTHDADQRP
jgi:ribosome-associated protein